MRASIKRLHASPLRYPGGKGALFPYLRDLLRENGLAGCMYVEPYAGGAGAALALLVTGRVSGIWINDLDPAIYAMWRSIVTNPDDFRSQISRIPLDVAEWHRQKDISRPSSGATEFERGFATFYLNRTNRSGMLTGGPIGGLDQTGSYKIDARFNRDALSERIRVIGLYADRIRVTSRDGVRVVKEASGMERVFVYADPPYFYKAGSLYMNSFGPNDHTALAMELNRRSALPWMLTYDDVPRVHDLYRQRFRRPLSLNYSAHRVVKATEVLILSDGVRDVASAAQPDLGLSVAGASS